MHRQSDTGLPPVRTAYGADLGDGFAAVVHARMTRGGVQHTSLLETQSADVQSALTETVQRIHADVMLQKAVLATALPVQDSMLRWLEAPFPSTAKARKVLPSLLDIQLPFPLETCIHGFPFLTSAESGRARALAVAARKENVAARIAACAELNMDPQCLDHEGLALWTQSLAEKPDEQGTRVIAYLGVDRTVWVIGQGNRPLSAHSTRIGTQQLGAPAATPNEAAQEWRDRALRNLRAQSAAQTDPLTAVRWWWTGPGAEDKDRIAELEALLRAPASEFYFDTHEQPATFLARALAVRALQRKSLAWNYRSGENAHPVVNRWRDTAVRQTAGTALAAGLALCLLNFSFGTLTQMKSREADRELDRIAKAVTGLQVIPRGQELVVVQRAIEEQDERLAPFLRAFQPSITEQLQRVLQWGEGSGLRYESITLRDEQLLVQGTADDWDGCEVLAQHLRDDGWTVNLDRQDAVAVEHVRFRLTAGRTS